MYPTAPSAGSPTSSEIPARPLPVPTHGPGGTFSVLARTTVSCAPSDVLELVRDTSTWPRWNTFCPRAEFREQGDGDGGEGWLNKGAKACIDVFLHGDGLVEGRTRSRVQDVEVTVLEALGREGGWEGPGPEGAKGWRIAWKSVGWSHWQLHSERVMEFREVEGGTGYLCWETFGGLLAPVVKRTVGSTLVDRFGDYARDVKQYLESTGVEEEVSTA
ncbi:hypothetical protein BJ875DRAFT_503425 [Amylocarpus encephaloides]|uniref:Coenzyme Q-binding protein COQ10 START domain-containing protein n=1 Tax=Amylocarpus encephaloides TaxID=45428 RepID=A0A9P7YMP5_9HELO|nr:hypothetical protein BJ875DRAFT_503425 [Amylocarpus encephaloides]